MLHHHTWFRSSNEQGCARRVHCIMCAVFSVARPHSQVVSPSYRHLCLCSLLHVNPVFDCLHILGILFSMKHVLSIVYNHLCALGPRFFSCSTSMSSMSAALLFLSAAIPFLYSSSLNADTNYGFPSTVGSAGHLGFVGIVPWPRTSRW